MFPVDGVQGGVQQPAQGQGDVWPGGGQAAGVTKVSKVKLYPQEIVKIVQWF